MPSMLPILYAAEHLETPDRSFDAETTAIISQAFERAWKEIHDKGRPDSWKEVIAERLIEIADRGERDPEILSQSVLISLGLKPSRFAI
jgi:hypothetical protein